MEAAGGASFNASGLQTRADAIGTERALVNFLGFGIELGNVERATSYAILAADAVFLLEIDDTVAVLNDRRIGGTRAQAARIGAVQTPVLAHQPTQRAVVRDVLIEPDQV